MQEVRAKRTLDRLAVLGAPRARVVRDGAVVEVATHDVVLDDLLELRAGDQSWPTGCSSLSGAFVVAGSGRCKVTAVGASSCASRITGKARLYTTTSSELMTGINRILKYISVAV